MGTVVFPDAKHKIFLEASLEVRAKRRAREMESAGRVADWREIRDEIQQRDESDRTRAVAPLRPAEGATHLDTSDLTLEEVVDRIVADVQEDA